MGANVTRGNGLLEAFLANKRAQLADKLIPSLYRGGHILDIGCGTFPVFLSKIEFSQKYAVDKTLTGKSQDLSDIGITFLNHDIELGGSLPFEDEYFDVVTMLAVFEHIDPLRMVDILKDIRRVLKNGGMYLLTTPAAWTNNLLKTMAALKLVSSIEIEEHKAAYNPRWISSLLETSFFPVEKINFGYFEVYMNIWVTAIK